MKESKKISILILFILTVLVIQFTGTYFTFTSVSTWYPTLKKASWNPPNWVFGPVWSLLYVMIALAGWIAFIQSKNQSQKNRAMLFYSAGLLLNLLWSFFFFFLKSPFLAFIDISALLLLIGITIVLFYRISKFSAYLLIPYFLWTLYASSLNLSTWVLNR